MPNRFPEYTTDYIAGIMSLRTPQKESLEILAKIIHSVKPDKQTDQQAVLKTVHTLYPSCTDFERNFIRAEALIPAVFGNALRRNKGY